jgi:hypothetical protein
VLAPLSTGKPPHPPFFQGEDAIKSTWRENFDSRTPKWIAGARRVGRSLEARCTTSQKSPLDRSRIELSLHRF